MNTKLRILALLFSTLAVTYGCKDECTVPAGTYEMSLEAIEGDCLENLYQPFEDLEDTLEVKEGRVCKRFVTERNIDVSKNCTLIAKFSGKQNRTGLHDGQSVIRVECDEGYTCRHLFSVDYVRVGAK